MDDSQKRQLTGKKRSYKQNKPALLLPCPRRLSHLPCLTLAWACSTHLASLFTPARQPPCRVMSNPRALLAYARRLSQLFEAAELPLVSLRTHSCYTAGGESSHRYDAALCSTLRCWRCCVRCAASTCCSCCHSTPTVLVPDHGMLAIQPASSQTQPWNPYDALKQYTICHCSQTVVRGGCGPPAGAGHPAAAAGALGARVAPGAGVRCQHATRASCQHGTQARCVACSPTPGCLCCSWVCDVSYAATTNKQLVVRARG
jgi:hypothetical protein